jgi:preprotein translocase subunit SecF
VGSGLFGAVTLRDFALALFVGLLTGAYSSIFVATPVLAWLKEREPRFGALRERSAVAAARQPAAAVAVTPVGPDGGSEAPVPEPAAPERPAPGRPAATRAPRPRQQRRRKRR